MKHQWSTVGNIQKPTTLSVKKSQDDALNRDHDAQDANVVRPSTGHGFHQGTKLNARADRRDRSPRQTRGRQPRCEDQQRRHRRCPWRRPQQGHDALGAIVACPQHGHGFHQEQEPPCHAEPASRLHKGGATPVHQPPVGRRRGHRPPASQAPGGRWQRKPQGGGVAAPLGAAPCGGGVTTGDHGPRRRRRDHRPTTRGGGDAARPRAGHPRRRRRGAATGRPPEAAEAVRPRAPAPATARPPHPARQQIRPWRARIRRGGSRDQPRRPAAARSAKSGQRDEEGSGRERRERGGRSRLRLGHGPPPPPGRKPAAAAATGGGPGGWVDGGARSPPSRPAGATPSKRDV